MESSFQWKLFDDEEEYEEAPLRDRKVDFPDLRLPEKRGELIRDVIALANTARLFGESAYLLFGIDNQGELAGIRNYIAVYRTEKEQTLREIRESVRHQLRQLFGEYIAPPMAKWDLQMEERNGLQAAYLMIAPVTPPQAFHARRAFTDNKKIGQPILEGDCWIRIGESKAKVSRQLISPNEAPYAYSSAQIPYLLPSDWLTYLTQLAASQRLLEAETIQAYQTLMTDRDEPIDSVLDQFLKGDSQLLVISGAAGSGKTSAMYRQVAKVTRYDIQEVDIIRQNEEFRPISGWVPLLISLRGLTIRDDGEFTRHHILSTINQYGSFWREPPTHAESLLSNRDIHWLLCMDGLDEMSSYDDQRKMLSTLHGFMARYSGVKILLTTRPDAVMSDFSQWDDVEVVTISGFAEVQIQAFIANFMSDADFQGSLSFLRSNHELWALCTYPLYLAAIMGELGRVQPTGLAEENQTPMVVTVNNAPIAPIEEVLSLPKSVNDALLSPPEDIAGEPPNASQVDPSEQQYEELPISLGRLLDRVYRRLWEREVRRQLMAPEDASDWWSRTARLAVNTDGHRPRFGSDYAMQVLYDIRVITRLLSLGVLDGEKLREVLKFRTTLTKAYFAATRLRALIETGDMDEATVAVQKMTEEFRVLLRQVLADLTSVDVSTVFPERSVQ